MRAVFLAALAIGLWTTPVLSQTIRVQSGDHADFTRLVLPIGADRDWQLEAQGDTEWTLTVSPAVDGFDLSGAFDLIQRTRLAALTSGDSLSLSLGCACAVDSFRFEGQFLVIDISDPDPDVRPLNQTASSLPTVAEDRITAAAALPDLAGLLLAPSDLPAVLPGQTPSRLGLAPRPILSSADTAGPPAAEAPNPRLAEAAEIMAEQLARAAASGLLDAALGQPMAANDPSPAEPLTSDLRVQQDLPNLQIAGVPPGDIPAEAPADDRFPSGPLPIRAETAFDTAIQLHLPIGPPRGETGCDGVPFDVNDWASGNEFTRELGDLRRELFDDRDTLTASGATQLAQHYLYFGFGAEARYWLSQLPDPPDALLHVAAIVDGATSTSFPPVESPEECSQGELLWRYMAGAVQRELAPDDTSALQRAYGEMPPGLRDQMGPRLSRQLSQDGHIGPARNIRDALHRGARTDPVILQLLDFDLGITPDASSDQMRGTLAEALRDDGGDPVAVMGHALAFDRNLGIRPASARIVAAEALLRENGNGPDTQDLWHEILLSHAALGQIDRAMAMLDDPTRAGPARAGALTDLIADRVAVGDTAALVILAYTHGADWRPDGSAAGRIQVQAIAALRAEELFEAAQILRDTRRPLILPAPENPADVPEDDSRAAWRDGDWTRLAETASGPHAEIATRMVNLALPEVPLATSSIIAPDLNALSETVGDSRALRAAVADLLSRPSLP